MSRLKLGLACKVKSLDGKPSMKPRPKIMEEQVIEDGNLLAGQ